MLSVDAVTAIIFYGIIVALIYKYRKNFEFHAKIPLGKKRYFPIVAQLRTKLGLNLMKKIGEGHSKAVKRIAHVGIYAGYLGMVGIILVLFSGVYNLFTDPNAPAVITPVIPGAKLPGIPFAFPFWHTLISLFIAIVIHEFSHGVVSKAHKIPVKSSGLAQVGPFSAAFVEPEEKKLEKHKPEVQNAIFAAGPWSNFLTAIVVIILMTVIFNPLSFAMLKDSDIKFVETIPEGPVDLAGIPAGTMIESADGDTILNLEKLTKIMQSKNPGDEIIFTDTEGKDYTVILGDAGPKEFLGFETGGRNTLIGVQLQVDEQPKVPGFIFSIYNWIKQLFTWVFLLSIGLGLGNLIPVGPIDGGRMWLIAAQKIFGKNLGKKVWNQTSYVLLGILIIAFVIPFIRGLF